MVEPESNAVVLSMEESEDLDGPQQGNRGGIKDNGGRTKDNREGTKDNGGGTAEENGGEVGEKDGYGHEKKDEGMMITFYRQNNISIIIGIL
tara:strand:+ start:225 stop:500 length:276 start_codon:yes stop_codon:yes gene_type:complete